MTRTPPGLLKTDPAAERAGFSGSSFHQFRARGIGPAYVRIGNKIFYRPEDVDAWIASGRVDPNSAALAMADHIEVVA